MRGFPPELILILVFGVLLLLKILKQKAARRRRAALPPPPEDVETPEAEWNSAPFEAEPPPPPPPVQALAHRHHDAAPAAAVQPRSRLRVARQALFGARWDMQEAIVVATILGRCRADEPHDIR